MPKSAKKSQTKKTTKRRAPSEAMSRRRTRTAGDSPERRRPAKRTKEAVTSGPRDCARLDDEELRLLAATREGAWMRLRRALARFFRRAA